MSGALDAILNANKIYAATTFWLAITIFFQSKDLSRIGAILLGISLIGAAACSTYQLQIQWLPIAEAMATDKVGTKHLLTHDELQVFESRVNFFIWILPFATASWGTNILSDALLRNYTYKDEWIVARIVRDFLSGEDIFESRKTTRPSFESRRDISEMARHDLQCLLAKLPQFTTVDQPQRLINMTDGSTVTRYFPRDIKDAFACKLTVSWNSEAARVEVDAERYLAVQFQLAETLGCNTIRLRREARTLFREIRDW
jgi:hypothetical protein